MAVVVVMSVEEEDKDEGGEDQPVLSSSTHHSEQGHQEHTDHSLHGYDVNSSSSSSQPSANTSSSHTTIESHTLAEHSKSLHMKSYPEYLQSYQHNLQQIQEAHESEPANKYSIIYNAYFKGKLLSDLLDPMLKKIRNCAGECDFAFSPLIRILYLNQDLYPIPDPSSLYTWQEQIVATMLKFPYWPDGISAKMDDIVFWSENHLFMTLSASYLVHQYAIDRKYVAQGTVALEDRLESKLLRKYLQVHQHELFSGVYEVNSHVYLPYSLAALMNLYDFANDEEIKCLSKALIDKIVYHVMLSTDPRHGIANLTGKYL